MSIPYFDAHCDTLTIAFESGKSLEKNDLHLDLSRLAEYSPRAQIFAVWRGHFEEKAAMLTDYAAESENAVFCRSIAEARRANAAGKTACLLSLEGMEQLDCSLDRLRIARERYGLLMANLCWNRDNALCGSAMDTGSGLTERGRAFVPAAQGLGVVLDLSHASDRTFWDSLEVSEKPMIASHSNSRSVWGAPRNLTDAQFAALVKQGGGAGINLCPEFLSEDKRLTDAVRHVERFLSLGGEKSVFLGCDLDGIDSLPRGFSGVQDMGKLYEALLRENLGEDLVRDIFYNNLMAILERAA